MAKYKRTKLGSIVKGKQEVDENNKPVFKDGKPVMKAPSFKVYGNHSILDGEYLNLESKVEQLKNLEKGVATGKLSADMVEKIRERIEKTPDFVLFDVIKLTKNTD